MSKYLHSYDWYIMRKGKDGLYEALQYGCNSEANPTSAYVMGIMEGLVREYGSNNILLLENLPIQVNTCCKPMEK